MKNVFIRLRDRVLSSRFRGAQASRQLGKRPNVGMERLTEFMKALGGRVAALQSEKRLWVAYPFGVGL